MTPQEKAKDLLDKFREFADGTDSETDRYSPKVEKEKAKQCALIAINELIKETGAKYWYDVKQEIELL
jgi:hypothetical protein